MSSPRLSHLILTICLTSLNHSFFPPVTHMLENITNLVNFMNIQLPHLASHKPFSRPPHQFDSASAITHNTYLPTALMSLIVWLSEKLIATPSFSSQVLLLAITVMISITGLDLFVVKVIDQINLLKAGGWVSRVSEDSSQLHHLTLQLSHQQPSTLKLLRW